MNETYNEHPALSSVDIITLLINPAALRKPYPPTEEMNLETIVQSVVFNQKVHYKIFPYRAGEQREAADKEAFKDGILLITKTTQENMTAVVTALGEFRKGINPNAIIERPFFAEEKGVEIKCKPNLYDPDTKTLYDLKVTYAPICTPREREATIVRGNHYIELAHYKDILEKNNCPVEKVILVVASYHYRFRFAANCGCYIGYFEFDNEFLEYGLQERNRAIDFYLENKDKSTKELATINTVVKKPAYFYVKENIGGFTI